MTIPDSVTSIGSSAFSGCTGLTSVTIPDSVTSIGSGAFTGCNNIIRTSKGICYVDNWVIDVINNSITTAEFEKNTKGIADWSFQGCNISDIIIPNSVKFIGKEAFRSSALRSVTIGISVECIGSQAFANCSLLSSVEFKNLENWYIENTESGSIQFISSETLLNKSEAVKLLKNNSAWLILKNKTSLKKG